MFAVSEEQINAFLEKANELNDDVEKTNVIYGVNKVAFEWLDDAFDCLKFVLLPNMRLLCQGLYLAQVAADLNMNPRKYKKDDYQRFKRLGHYVAREHNASIND